MEQKPRIFALAALLAAVFACESSLAQLRVVSWNTAGGPREGLGDILEAIGNESVNGIAKPIDILSLQEQSSVATTTQSIVAELNAIYGAGTYARGTLEGSTSGAGRPGIIYNTNTVSLSSEVAIGVVSPSDQARQTLEYSLLPTGYDTRLYLYSSHFKAGTGSSDQARRLIEATAIRDTADLNAQFTDSDNIIFTGDYNIRSSTEASYQELLSPGPARAFDPVNAPGTWHDNGTFEQWHTQSPSTNPQGGLTGGGMDDRFDFQLVSGSLIDNEGYSYITGSYRVFGNNGTHSLNGNISSGTGASPAILSALEAVSDHLPVVADYQVPAMAEFLETSELPDRLVLGSLVDVQITVSNTADVVAPNGADELDYSITTQEQVSGFASGTDAALGGGNTHSFPFATSTLGSATGLLFFNIESQDTLGPGFPLALDTDIVSPTGDFDDDADRDGLDFLTWQQGSGVGTWLFEGDADGSRVIDGADLSLWQSQYGTLSPLIAVPEPSALALVLIAACCRRCRSYIL